MTFIDELLRERSDELSIRLSLGGSLRTVLITPQFATSRHVVGLVFNEASTEPVLVVKVPRRPGDNAGVRREAKILRELAAASAGSLQGAPKVLGCLDVGAYSVLVETVVRGSPLDPATVAADRGRAVRMGVDFVARLPVTRSARDNAGWYDAAVATPVARLVSLAPLGGSTARLAEVTHRFLRPLREARIPAVLEHADLSHPNLFAQPSGRLGVVDWERATTEGMPGHDLAFLLQYLGESAASAFDPPAQRHAFDAAFVDADAWARPLLQQHLRERGVDSALLPHILVATWARSAATLAERLVPEELSATSSHGNGPAIRQIEDAQIAATVSSDRDVMLWEHAVQRLAG